MTLKALSTHVYIGLAVLDPQKATIKFRIHYQNKLYCRVVTVPALDQVEPFTVYYKCCVVVCSTFILYSLCI